MKLESCSLSDLSGLRYEFSAGHLASGHGIVAVHFSGNMANSGTTDDYAFASAIVMAALEAWQPWASIIDLRNVCYSWGDRMEDVLLSPQRWAEVVTRTRRIFTGDRLPERFPTAVVTSEQSADALASLIAEQMNMKPAALLFPTMGSAIDSLTVQLANTPLV